MADIRFQGGASNNASNVIAKYTTGGAGLFGGGTNALAGDSTGSRLNIYKGTIETFPSFTNVSSRSADLLVQITLSTAFSNAGNVTVSGVQYYRFTAGAGPAATATQSGTATWFLMFNNGSSGDLTTRGGMLGTVGTAGSGADLIIGSTNIVSGQTYSSSGIIMNWPIIWNL